jgi:hypothetical protein
LVFFTQIRKKVFHANVIISAIIDPDFKKAEYFGQQTFEPLFTLFRLKFKTNIFENEIEILLAELMEHRNFVFFHPFENIFIVERLFERKCFFTTGIV